MWPIQSKGRTSLVYTNMLQAATRIIKYVNGAGVRVVGKEEYKTNKNRKNYR